VYFSDLQICPIRHLQTTDTVLISQIGDRPTLLRV